MKEKSYIEHLKAHADQVEDMEEAVRQSRSGNKNWSKPVSLTTRYHGHHSR